MVGGISLVFSLRHIQLSSVDSLTSDGEAQEMTDVLFGLGLLRHLLVLPFLPRLLELSITGSEGGGRGRQVVLVLHSALQRVLPARSSLQVVRGKLLLRLPLTHVRLDVVMNLEIINRVYSLVSFL